MISAELKVDMVELVKIDDQGELNMRRSLGDITDLMESIKTNGVMTPILVKANGDETFQLICGFRRVSASKECGLTTIPARIVGEVSQIEMFSLNLMENIQRRNLSPIEEAEGFQKAVNFGASIDQLSVMLGLRPVYIQQRLLLLNMSESLQQAIHNGQLSMSAAKEIERLPKEFHDSGIEIAMDATAAQVRKFVEKKLRRIAPQAEIEEVKKREKDETEDYLQDKAREIRKKVKNAMLLTVRAYIPDMIDAVNQAELGLVPTGFMKMLLEALSAIPKTEEEMEAAMPLVKERVNTIQLPVEELPTEPEFWGGPEKAAAKAFERLIQCAKEQLEGFDEIKEVEANKRLVRIAFDRIGGAGIPRCTQMDVIALANELNVKIQQEEPTKEEEEEKKSVEE